MSTACHNCGSVLTGRWCHDCGQDSRDPLRVLASIVGEFADAALSWDSKLARTLKALLFEPGFLSNEFVAGRRARYVGPVRLYLLASIVYAATYAAFGGKASLVYLVGGGDLIAGFGEIARLERWLSFVLLGLMPLAAVIVAVVFHRTGITFARHLVFVLHLSSVALILWALGCPCAYAAVHLVGALGELAVVLVVNGAIAFHTYRAARAHYGRGELDTFWRVAAYGLTSALLIRAVVLGLGRLIGGA